MLRINHALALSLVAGLLLLGTPAYGVMLVFGEPDFEWVQTGGSATPYHIWYVGDYWAQTFPGTGLGSANEMDLRLYVDDNILTSGDQVDLDVLLNTTKIGDLVIPSGTSGVMDFNFSFSTISVVCPMLRANSSVHSIKGGRISWNPNRRNTSLAIVSPAEVRSTWPYGSCSTRPSSASFLTAAVTLGLLTASSSLI